MNTRRLVLDISSARSGKVYLFGGWVNQVFIHGRKDTVTRSYADLWQLRINIPGGFYEDVDLEEESRFAKAGPWKRCLGCGNAGPGAGVKECRGAFLALLKRFLWQLTKY